MCANRFVSACDRSGRRSAHMVGLVENSWKKNGWKRCKVFDSHRLRGLELEQLGNILALHPNRRSILAIFM